MSDAKTLRLETRSPGVAIVWMDDPDAPMNTLKAGLEAEFDELLGELQRLSDLQALVFASGKPDSFIAGADLDMLRNVATVEQGRALSELSQGIQARLAALQVPTAAAIHGSCLGGGLELALAFDVRVATDDPNTRLGLPEVQLGLLPGGGGTQRLPRLVGADRALDLLLTGKQLDARRAKAIGLVDEVVPKPHLLEAAIRGALSRRGKTPKLGWPERLRRFALAGNPLGRRLLFDQARERTLAKTRGNYPAPEKILEVTRLGLERGLKAGLEAEARAFGDLVVSPQARELIYLFFANTALKKDPGVDDSSVQPRQLRRVGVLGGGLMGAGISLVTVLKARTPVRLKDKDDRGVGHGIAYVHRDLDRRVARKRLTGLERVHTAARLTGTIDYSGFGDLDLVIEAVFEDLELKQRMVREVEDAGPDEVIFASNTSALPIARIAEASRHPQTVIGMHYFSPVEKMPLLEIVVTPRTAAWVTATCVRLGKAQGKTVIVVRDGPGFYTSRILAPYINEAAWLLAEGVPVQDIDRALKDFGFPVGPLTLLDEVGLDVAGKVARTLGDAFGERLAPPPVMARLQADERHGRKSRRGFYLYQDGNKGDKEVDSSVYGVMGVEPGKRLPPREMAERCALQMVNEALRCFGEGILRSARDGNVGAVFGLGFPPFLGGPFRYVDQRGAKAVLDKLEGYRQRFGERFAPAPLLRELARGGGAFHGDRPVEPGGGGGEAEV